ncbi:hypothetical protein [Oxynema aestuarii]|uniref:Uncharacterized protein n=1 Tax=Oxynema aestuarii AP17 TaxID=2064643 RepID=A0A6H1TWA0_9CYAN|nr:hypothetical protein [Oxynema aestuarii]QIZ69599.1 hypothetical protein HCG48_02520 [Oxynema aestuarii AP17]RMH74781.1 MAG: hypothetical protein D6680_13630 [Cyanobacteria bacterium J007]
MIGTLGIEAFVRSVENKAIPFEKTPLLTDRTRLRCYWDNDPRFSSTSDLRGGDRPLGIDFLLDYDRDRKFSMISITLWQWDYHNGLL